MRAVGCRASPRIRALAPEKSRSCEPWMSSSVMLCMLCGSHRMRGRSRPARHERSLFMSISLPRGSSTS
jgi:hypothetical protein